MKELKEIEEKIQNLKNEQLFLIFSNTELSKLDKLKLINEYDLFEIKNRIQRVFEDLRLKWEKELTLKHNHSSVRVTDFILNGDLQRNQIINLVEITENLYNSHEDLNEEMSVLFETFFHKKYKMKIADVIDYICDWCFKNKCVIFKFDW